MRIESDEERQFEVVARTFFRLDGPRNYPRGELHRLCRKNFPSLSEARITHIVEASRLHDQERRRKNKRERITR
jgi:hypothetical protein